MGGRAALAAALGVAVAWGCVRLPQQVSAGRPTALGSADVLHGRHGRELAMDVPEYVRGKGKYQWFLPKEDRENGISYFGSHTRLRAAMDKLRRGEKLHISTIGGSITGGQGAVDAPNWPQYVFNYLKDTYGDDNIVAVNGAIAGTLSAYMSVCHNMHVLADADIVFVEYSVNDYHSVTPLFENNQRRAFERLLRKLMTYKNSPAVVLVHAYMWSQAIPHAGSFWSNAEREFAELQLYYHMPALSLKTAVYHHLKANEEGFRVDKTRNEDVEGLKNKVFYFDPVHPDGRTGARCIAELVMHLLQKVHDELEVVPMSDAERASAVAELPPPMIPGNFESVNNKCFIGNQFTATVTDHVDWEWINESKSMRPKWGFVTTTVGAVIKMLVDTRVAATHTPRVFSNVAAPGSPDDVLIELAYLKSYEHMGVASITCEGECRCQPSELDAHGVERNSQVHLHNFYASPAEECIVVVQVLDKTSSGEHKFKLTGIMISEESGQSPGIQNHMAVEYVSDISQRSTDGHFNIENHA